MNAIGIIVEYNPFHNGHAFHLKKTIETTEADIVIAVMSGQFLQRGEPALLPKWYRTQMALMAGVDIVLELPYQFSTQKADTFAKGAVQILAAAGCKGICFGSENGDINDFYKTYEFLHEHQDEYEQKIKFHIESGVSYPTALSLAFLDLNPSKSIVDLSKPNNILGFQYVKAVKEQQAPMKLYTIARTNNYHDPHLAPNSIASATSIRNALFSENGQLEHIESYLPNPVYAILQDYSVQFGKFHQWEDYWPYLRFRLLQSSPESLKEIYEMVEGLENRMIRAALHANSFLQFMKEVKTKRYTWTRLQRVCAHLLTNSTREEMESRMKKASYIRLLGMNEKGRAYLNKWKSQSPLPIVSKISSFHDNTIDLDIRASRIYAIGANNDKRQELIDKEFTQPPIYLRK